MEILLLLLVASISVAACFLIGFLWAARSGQYDDVHTPALRMLFDDRAHSEQRP